MRPLSALREFLPRRFRADQAIVPVVRLSGVIGFSTPLRPGLTVAGIARTLDRLFAVRNAAAVALVINSPGGSAAQSHLIFRRIRQLAEEAPNIKYVKDTSGDFDQATVLIHSLSDVVTTFVGMDTAYLSSLVEGADGAVVGAANFLGPGLVGIYDRVKAGDLASAQSSWEAIFGMMKALGAGSAYVSGVKGAMRIVGHPVGDPRAPIRPLGATRARQFEALLNGIDHHMLTGHQA